MRATCLLLVLAFTCGALASIEREPVKVDRNNAGPKYDIDELERTRVLAENNNNQDTNQLLAGPRPESNSDRDDNSHQDTPMISIRRIFLVPVMSGPSSSQGVESDRPSDPMRALFGPPPQPSRSLFSPFSSHHLFGGDEASRPKPMNPDESQERPVLMGPAGGAGEQEASERPRPMSAMFDPVEMLMEAMRQALNPANMMPQPPAPDAGDLNKDASSTNSDKKPETGVDKSFNSTKEDIVEIDGKKYLRKTVIQRHVGDGIMFMTRRLIFSPLNETETTTTTTTEAGNNKAATISTTTIEPSTEQPSKEAEKIDEPAPKPVAPEQPVPPQQNPSSTTTTTAAADKEETTTTTPRSLGDKIGEAIVTEMERLTEKAVERKQESTTTSSTTEKSASA